MTIRLTLETTDTAYGTSTSITSLRLLFLRSLQVSFKTLTPSSIVVFVMAALFLSGNSAAPAQESHKTADEAIKQKLDELLQQPNSVLTKMQTFQTENKPDDGKPKLRPPLAATIGADIFFLVSESTAFNPHIKALSVHIENHSQETLVMDGDRAFISEQSGDSAKTLCLAEREIDAFGKPPETIKGKIKTDTLQTIAAALTVGAVPTADGIIKAHGPIKKRYEWDEQRREREETRLGKRLLYPGDKTDGKIYFAGNESFSQKVLTIPVKSFYDGSEQAALRKAIEPPR